MRILKNIFIRVRNAAATGAVAFLALPAVAHAAAPELGIEFVTASGLAQTDVRTLVARIIGAFFVLLGLIAVGLVLYAGFQWMTAGGNEEKVKNAKRILTQALIGAVIILSAYAIVQFVFNALQGTGSGGNIGSNGCGNGAASCCPPGQTCAINVAGGQGFRVTGIAPAGAGPNSAGWPKNYALTVGFNAAVAEASATTATVDVSKCNARVDGGGTAQPYRGSNCGSSVSGTVTVDGSRVTFRPSGTAGENATDFEANFWYRIRVQGGAIRDVSGNALACPFQTADISSPEAGASYCERAVAFNDQRDVQPPTVTLNAPASPPAYCASTTVTTAQIFATATDDFLVSGVDFLLDGGTAGLVNASGAPADKSVNGELTSPFNSTDIHVDLAALAPGTHSISAVARDGVPQSSQTATKSFSVMPATCCNGLRDGGETANDCGGQCGACNGGTCTTNAQCASGACVAGKCAVLPNIQGISPFKGGPGTLVTFTGVGFGTSGSVTWLGADTDGNGDVAGDADDVTSQACAPQAWTDTRAVVAVPTGAVSGPLKLTTAVGSDRTDDSATPPSLPQFAVTNAVIPGVCYVSPSSGAPGTKVTVNGSGFGASQTTSVGPGTVMLGLNSATVATCEAGSTDCGWSDNKIVVTAPPIPENDYPVQVMVGATTSNPGSFLLQSGGTRGEPRVAGVIPEKAGVGSYVTILGSNFGNGRGIVRFGNGAEVAFGQEPICSDNWRDNAIVVKVPARYQGGLDVANSAAGVAHTVTVVTSAPARASNADVTLAITNEAPLPGVCSITPDNGPAGTTVSIKGEGFGSRAVNAVGPASSPRFAVNFFENVAATLYSGWEDTYIGTVVAGDLTDKATWPKTGPVSVTVNNAVSGNAVPFIVQDCRDAGAVCKAGTQCCTNGSCQTSCAPIAKNSAYGWQFSTSVLPSLPVVVERASCSANPAQMQSPSPTHDAQDACVNAQFFVEFSKPLHRPRFTSSTVTVEECGSGASASCSGVMVPLQPITNANFAGCDLNAGCTTFQSQPASTYNGGIWKANTWYRVRLISNATSNIGLREAGQNGQFLDGDLDRKGGGDYVTTFRTRNSSEACQLSSVQVIPSAHTITQDETSEGFNAGLLANNCNLLQCGAGQAYAINWLMTSQYLQSVSTVNNGCTQMVRAVGETQVGVPTALRASVNVLPANPGVQPKEGKSDVTVKFAEPRVVSLRPKAECSTACINAVVGATFNVPMDPQTLNNTNVQILRCRNASCLPPFLTDLGNGVTAQAVAAPVGPPAPGSNVNVYTDVTLQLTGNLQQGTFYLVRIRGGAGGVKSKSGVALSGLNDGAYYSWKFRTKDDNSACAVSRTTLFPATAELRYVGDRAGLQARAYGAADQCAEEGQELDAAAYNWLWNFVEPNRVLQGFVNGGPGFYPPHTATTPSSSVDTGRPRAGCSANCLFVGSQNVQPQCGDGQLNAKFEACDDGNANDSDACRNNCTLTGTTAPACGNGTVDAGEDCDMIGGVFPAGCKEPGKHVDGFGDNIGCLFTGATSVAGSMCGDGYAGDGEACDDGNTSNGDGCSSNCLKEGTLRSCLGAPAGAACVNVCGNGTAEPGEDAACEPNPGANNCDVRTCLKRGTDACDQGGGAKCCGNGVADPGEDPGCDAAGGVAAYCTSRCLLKGSSAFYDRPSFCGDGIAGMGEQAACEATGGDTRRDAYQVVVGNVKPGFNASSAEGNTTTVKAAVTGVSDARTGSANVSLSCACKSQPEGTQDAFCSGINPSSGGGVAPFTDNLACADSGCCLPRPTVTNAAPTSYGACRNAAVEIVFSELMNDATVASNLVVGYSNGNEACPNGVAEVLPLATGEEPSFFRRVWNGIATFVRNAILRPVFGVTGTDTGFDEEKYCQIPGTVSLRVDGVGLGRKTVATFAPLRAMPANRYIRIRLNDGVRSALGTPLVPSGAGASGYNAYFGTGADVCGISTVEVLPKSLLLSSVADTQTVTAYAKAANNQAIVPTLDYAWRWAWDPVASTVPIVVTPRTANNNTCSLGVQCTQAGGCPCTQSALTSTCMVANGQDSCTTSVPATQPYADVRVRGGSSLDGGFTAVNSRGSLPINARAVVSNTTFSSQVSTGTANAVVLLCQNPWPKYTPCTDSSCTADFWTPFHDTFTNVEFYYCRDSAAAAGAAGGTALPCLKETPATVTSPIPGILREYLFTFDTNLANCPNGPQRLGDWQSDAVGLRVAGNTSHESISDWYAGRGFRGSPTPTLVDGYEALMEGRTVYVNAGSKNTSAGQQRLYTNAYVLSHSEGAQTETTAIFNQILSNVDFNSNPELRDMRICRVGDLRTDEPIVCATDNDCRVDATGKPVAGRETFTCSADKVRCMDGTRIAYEAGMPQSCSSDLDCMQSANGTSLGRPATVACDAPKSKLRRDVKRWSDLTTMRNELINRGAGAYPSIEAGSFIRSQTNSTWPSWTAVLGAAIGGNLPADPLNRHGACDPENKDEYDAETCWNATARQYQCPVDSHVYEYRSLGGTNFALRNDFEYVTSGTAWGGTTCPERNGANGVALPACATDPACVVEANGSCNFRTGKLNIGGSIPPFTANVCTNVPQSTATGGTCGDGVKTAGEFCEIGEVQAGACDADPTAGTRSGSLTKVCNSTCTAFVVAGRCSSNSPRPGVSCNDSAECGTGGTCVNFENFRCAGPAGNAKNGAVCVTNSECGSGGLCVSACGGGACGDGNVQAPEKCDDGPLNGTFGHCAVGCMQMGLSCGDGQRSPNEACDCGAKNGQYAFNGVISTGAASSCNTGSTNVASCGWDCSTAGPRCGDGIRNGGEACDGGFEEFRGFCNDRAQTGCDTSAQCPSIGRCQSGQCTNGNSVSCTTDADCVASCGNFCATPEQRQRRLCNSNRPNASNDDDIACQWSQWTCTAPGTCGNGRTETGEQCDDGNTNNNDSCIIDPTKPGGAAMCKTALCGDGFVNRVSGEECDSGTLNNRACTPEYGLTCNFCNASCRTVTVSGAFCGDNKVQNSTTTPQGPEQCEGTIGLGSGNLCVSTRPEHQSFGLITGIAGCSSGTCGLVCEDRDSVVCQPSGPDSDAPGTSWDRCDYVSGAASTYCQTLHNLTDEHYTTPQSLANTVFLAPWPERSGHASRFRDSCDPDDDNDGVPDGLDCNATDPTVHGSYAIPNTRFSIAAAAEDKADLIDNDCDGIPLGVARVEGEVLNVQTGGKLDGAAIRLSCEGAFVGMLDANGAVVDQVGAPLGPLGGVTPSGRYDADGKFGLTVPFDIRKCGKTSGSVRLNFEVLPASGQQLCSGNRVRQSVTTNLSFTMGGAQPQFFDGGLALGYPGEGVRFDVSPKPAAGYVVASLTWGTSDPLDFQMYSSDGKKVNGAVPSVTDGAYRYRRTDFSRYVGTGQTHTQSISVNRKPAVSYNFWVQGPSANSGGPLCTDPNGCTSFRDSNIDILAGSSQTQDFNWINQLGFGTATGAKQGPKLRIYYDNCLEYKPETFARWPTFLNNTSARWLAFLTVPNVSLPESGNSSCDSKYDYCCVAGTQAGPCAALCTSNGTNGNGMSCVGAID